MGDKLCLFHADPVLGKYLLNEVMEGGNFGHYETIV